MRGKLLKGKITNAVWKKQLLRDLPKLNMPYYRVDKITFVKHTNRWIAAKLTFCIPHASWIKLTDYCVVHKNYISYDNGCVEITSFR